MWGRGSGVRHQTRTANGFTVDDTEGKDGELIPVKEERLEPDEEDDGQYAELDKSKGGGEAETRLAVHEADVRTKDKEDHKDGPPMPTEVEDLETDDDDDGGQPYAQMMWTHDGPTL